ncbi:MAG: DNA translocase FtsK, partial [Pseudolabrys sp.]|nr:DNA translocase FtsK [Pseudolabrys sp.]
MSMTDRSLDVVAFVSDHFRDFLRRRIRELTGLALITVALLAAIALTTWSVQDPSLSHATRVSGPTNNLLGASGAIVADILMQVFGLAATALLIPPGVYGWRLLMHNPLGGKWRAIAWLPTILVFAAFLSCLPRTANWPLPTGLGGVVGDALLRAPAAFGIGLRGFPLFLLAMVLGSAALVLLIVAIGFRMPQSRGRMSVHRIEPTFEDEEAIEDEPRGPIVFGWLSHHVLSFKARLGRMLSRAPRAQRVAMPVPRRGRTEPNFGGNVGVPVRAPQLAPEVDEIEDAPEAEAPAAPKRRTVAARPAARKGGYQLPPLNLLSAVKVTERTTLSNEQIEENAATLKNVLNDFGVRGEIINARPGPVVTLYELEPAPGIKSSRVIGLADDIARSMSAVSARVAVVPGRNAIGIELPNPTREKVLLREQLDSDEYNEATAKLPLCLGKTIGGEPVVVDLARMPHLLIAGTTGSGKSVAINTMLLSLLYRLRPDQCRLIMIDPKMLELSVYDGIPHLLSPVVTDPKKAVVALKWAVREMEERYKKMSKIGVRNIDGYNARVAESKSKGEKLSRTVHTGYDKESGEAIYEREELDLDLLPFIVVIVDEMADL